MSQIEVDSLCFEFPDSWLVGKYDDWELYKNRFVRMWNGIKGIDLLAVDPQDKTVWMIEVKDYRQAQRTKSIDLAEEIARKVADTLAALLPAKIHASNRGERELAKTALAGKNLRVVLHLEQPAKTSSLRPRAIDPAIVKQKLRRILKPIDAHPLVVEKARMGTLPWRVA